MKVTLTTDEVWPRTVAVTSREFVIGRAADCDLRLQSPLVSRHHCMVTEQDGRLFVRDLGSSNGTGLNNQPLIGERLLHHQDELWVAATPVKVHIQRDRSVAGMVHRLREVFHLLPGESGSTSPSPTGIAR